jgi:hypothetical protein
MSMAHRVASHNKTSNAYPVHCLASNPVCSGIPPVLALGGSARASSGPLLGDSATALVRTVGSSLHSRRRQLRAYLHRFAHCSRSRDAGSFLMPQKSSLPSGRTKSSATRCTSVDWLCSLVLASSSNRRQFSCSVHSGFSPLTSSSLFTKGRFCWKSLGLPTWGTAERYPAGFPDGDSEPPKP